MNTGNSTILVVGGNTTDMLKIAQDNRDLGNVVYHVHTLVEAIRMIEKIPSGGYFPFDEIHLDNTVSPLGVGENWRELGKVYYQIKKEFGDLKSGALFLKFIEFLYPRLKNPILQQSVSQIIMHIETRGHDKPFEEATGVAKELPGLKLVNAQNLPAPAPTLHFPESHMIKLGDATRWAA